MRCEIFARPSTNFDAATPVNVAQMPASGGSGGTTREIAVASVILSPAPDRKKLAGLTFATVNEKMDVVSVTPGAIYKPPAETPSEHRLNVAFSLLLVATVIGLWIYFR